MRASTAFTRARRALAAAMIAAASLAHGQVFESVVMPGKVIEGHAKLEMQCDSCHKRFEKAAQSRLCQDCHKDVAADASAKRGYHGRAPEAQGKECRACHTEHKGLEAKIAQFDPAKFDHGRTDFPLHGAHGAAGVECRSCHEAGKRWREAPSACVECHRKHDTHKGQLGSGCADCDSERTWKEPRFDHGKTRFPLVGKHAGAKCAACHEKSYKEARSTLEPVVEHPHCADCRNTALLMYTDILEIQEDYDKAVDILGQIPDSILSQQKKQERIDGMRRKTLPLPSKP